MTDIFSNIISAAAGSASGALLTYFLPRRYRKAAPTPVLRFDFADLAEHENLGAEGFRHIQSKTELLISGTLRNLGPVLATDVALDLYHFRSANGLPVHEIAGIRVADAIAAGEALAWSKAIRLADLTVDGRYYRSGTTGVFSDDTRSKYYHFHVVFTWKNALGEPFSTLYAMEKVVENNTFKRNKMVFIRQLGKYKPKANFPTEWRHEIGRGVSLKELRIESPM
jgi:hypothetical protein